MEPKHDVSSNEVGGSHNSVSIQTLGNKEKTASSQESPHNYTDNLPNKNKHEFVMPVINNIVLNNKGNQDSNLKPQLNQEVNELFKLKSINHCLQKEPLDFLSDNMCEIDGCILSNNISDSPCVKEIPINILFPVQTQKSSDEIVGVSAGKHFALLTQTVVDEDKMMVMPHKKPVYAINNNYDKSIQTLTASSSLPARQLPLFTNNIYGGYSPLLPIQKIQGIFGFPIYHCENRYNYSPLVNLKYISKIELRYEKKSMTFKRIFRYHPYHTSEPVINDFRNCSFLVGDLGKYSCTITSNHSIVPYLQKKRIMKRDMEMYPSKITNNDLAVSYIQEEATMTTKVQKYSYTITNKEFGVEFSLILRPEQIKVVCHVSSKARESHDQISLHILGNKEKTSSSQEGLHDDYIDKILQESRNKYCMPFNTNIVLQIKHTNLDLNLKRQLIQEISKQFKLDSLLKESLVFSLDNMHEVGQCTVSKTVMDSPCVKEISINIISPVQAQKSSCKIIEVSAKKHFDLRIKTVVDRDKMMMMTYDKKPDYAINNNYNKIIQNITALPFLPSIQFQDLYTNFNFDDCVTYLPPPNNRGAMYHYENISYSKPSSVFPKGQSKIKLKYDKMNMKYKFLPRIHPYSTSKPETNGSYVIPLRTTNKPFVPYVQKERGIKSKIGKYFHKMTDKHLIVPNVQQKGITKMDIEKYPYTFTSNHQNVPYNNHPNVPYVQEKEIMKRDIENYPHTSTSHHPVFPYVQRTEMIKRDIENYPHTSSSHHPVVPYLQGKEIMKRDIENYPHTSTSHPIFPYVQRTEIIKRDTENYPHTSTSHQPVVPYMQEKEIMKRDVENYPHTSTSHQPILPYAQRTEMMKRYIEKYPYTSDSHCPIVPYLQEEIMTWAYPELSPDEEFKTMYGICKKENYSSRDFPVVQAPEIPSVNEVQTGQCSKLVYSVAETVNDEVFGLTTCLKLTPKSKTVIYPQTHSDVKNKINFEFTNLLQKECFSTAIESDLLRKHISYAIAILDKDIAKNDREIEQNQNDNEGLESSFDNDIDKGVNISNRYIFSTADKGILATPTVCEKSSQTTSFKRGACENPIEFEEVNKCKKSRPDEKEYNGKFPLIFDTCLSLESPGGRLDKYTDLYKSHSFELNQETEINNDELEGESDVGQFEAPYINSKVDEETRSIDLGDESFFGDEKIVPSVSSSAPDVDDEERRSIDLGDESFFDGGKFVPSISFSDLDDEETRSMDLCDGSFFDNENIVRSINSASEDENEETRSMNLDDESFFDNEEIEDDQLNWSTETSESEAVYDQSVPVQHEEVLKD